MAHVTVQEFRTVFPFFADPVAYRDAQIQFFLDMGYRRLSVLVWGDEQDYGVQLFAAHYLFNAGPVNGAGSATGGGAVTGLVTSKQVDKVSASFDVGATTYANAGFWNTSIWGVQFWQLLMMFGAGGIQLPIGIEDNYPGYGDGFPWV